YTETWYRLADVNSLDELVNSLTKLGVRESKLKSSLIKQKDVIANSITRGNARESKSPDLVDGEGEDEDLCPESLTPLRKSIVHLASDLRDSYLTSVGSVDAFEAELICCRGLDDVKGKMAELADSIPPSAIVKRLDMKVAQQTGHYSHLILDRWKSRLMECHNPSAVHLLRSYLDSRINWKKSVVEKRCNACGSRRSPEAKIACGNCEMVVHYYCTRPKLQEKPTFWLCPSCVLQEVKKKKEDTVNQRVSTKPNYKEDSVASGDEFADDESDVSGSDDNDDDFFSKKPRRTQKRKGFSIFDDEVEEKISQSKRPKVNKVYEDCLELLERVKTSNRLYRTLQGIPAGRATRRATPSSLDSLEEAISQYASVTTFAADLDSFLKYAHSYLEEHNERKLEDLDNLLLELDLHSIIKLR
ncbi:PHD-finger, partial [Necator americanus]